MHGSVSYLNPEGQELIEHLLDELPGAMRVRIRQGRPGGAVMPRCATRIAPRAQDGCPGCSTVRLMFEGSPKNSSRQMTGYVPPTWWNRSSRVTPAWISPDACRVAPGGAGPHGPLHRNCRRSSRLRAVDTNRSFRGALEQAARRQGLVAAMSAIGLERWSVARHDRGGRVAYRMALDAPSLVERLVILDVVPTLDMAEQCSHEITKFLLDPAISIVEPERECRVTSG